MDEENFSPEEKLHIKWIYDNYKTITLFYLDRTNSIENMINAGIARLYTDNKKHKDLLIEMLISKLTATQKAAVISALCSLDSKLLNYRIEMLCNEYLRLYKIRNRIAHSYVVATPNIIRKMDKTKIAIRSVGHTQPTFIHVNEFNNDSICATILNHKFFNLISKINPIT